MGVIDKVEVRIPAQRWFSKEFETVYRDIRPKPFRDSRHYTCRRPPRVRIPSHSAYGLYTGQERKPQAGTVGHRHDELRREWATRSSGFSTVDARRLALMRVDLAADVRGCAGRVVRAPCAGTLEQWVCDIGQVDCETSEYARMGRRAGADVLPRQAPQLSFGSTTRSQSITTNTRN